MDYQKRNNMRQGNEMRKRRAMMSEQGGLSSGFKPNRPERMGQVLPGAKPTMGRTAPQPVASKISRIQRPGAMDSMQANKSALMNRVSGVQSKVRSIGRPTPRLGTPSPVPVQGTPARRFRRRPMQRPMV